MVTLLLRRLGTPVLAGLAVFILSFPLTTNGHGPVAHPVLAAVASGPASDDRPDPTRRQAPRQLIVGELAPAPPPAPAPDSAPAPLLAAAPAPAAAPHIGA